MFKKVLKEKRGEMVIRKIRACKEIGKETVERYDQADE